MCVVDMCVNIWVCNHTLNLVKELSNVGTVSALRKKHKTKEITISKNKKIPLLASAEFHEFGRVFV